jgi:hypothetical protein
LQIILLAENPKSDLVECDICWKVVTKKQLLRHKNILHFNKRPYPCLFCDSRYGENGNLYKHMRRKHAEEYAAYLRENPDYRAVPDVGYSRRGRKPGL